MGLNKDIQYSRGVNLPLGFVYQSLGDPFCIAQMPSPCPSCWKTLIFTWCTHTHPIPKSLWSKYIYYIWQYCTCQPPTKSPRYSLHTVLSRISSPTIHKFNQDIYIYEEDNFTISICLAYGRWTSEKRTLFLYDKCLQNNVDDPTLFLSWSFILRCDFDLFLNIIVIQF